jgi:16S rRNA processing protein RimM
MKVTEVSDIFLGRIVKAFGIRGELKLHPSDDFWDDVLRSKRLMMQAPTEDGDERRPVAFKSTRPHGRSYVVRIDGVDDRNAAEDVVGAEVFVAEDELDVAFPDELLPFQVVGVTAKDEAGEVLGKVSSVIRSAAHDIYEVENNKGTFMVPAVPEFILGIDEEKKEMIIRPMPGLIED